VVASVSHRCEETNKKMKVLIIGNIALPDGVKTAKCRCSKLALFSWS
jgi:hypothetical protein